VYPESDSAAFAPSHKKICVGSASLPTMFCLFAFFTAGCGGVDEIRRYQVPKPDRMFAAIVFEGESPWAFSVAGSKHSLEQHAAAFRSLIKSVRFADGRPTWTLPKGWREKPTSRSGVVRPEFGPADKATRVNVTPLMMPNLPQTTFVLFNVNHWRAQMRLPPIAKEQLDRETERIELEGGVATLVDFLGTLDPDAMEQAHSGAMVRGAPGPRKPVADATSSGDDSGAISFDAPEAWEPGQREVSRGPISIVYDAAFKVTDGEQRLDVTVNRMGSGGTALWNVNRWRKQVGLGPIESDDLDQSLKDIQIDGTAAKYMEIVGPTDSIFVATAARGGVTWYLKLIGANELADREKGNFQKFLESVKFK